MMAGQIEEPIGFSFEAHSIHSGSISFGRFAHEPLLWERRSSFSHNRIQEEVARCSKHKIVTEKKAYFEAQFKKKALLRQCSLDELTVKKFGTDETKDSDMRNYQEVNDIVQRNKNDASSESSVYIGYREDFDYMQEAKVNVHFDESSDGSNDFDEAMEYHIEGREILISEPVKLPSSDSVVAKSKVDAGTVIGADTQTVLDWTYSRCNSAEHDIEVEKNIDAYTCYVEEDCKAIDLCAGSRKTEKEPDAVSIHEDVSPKIVVTVKPSGTELNHKVTCTQRNSLCEASKVSSSSIKRTEKPIAMETKTFKQSKLVPYKAKKLTRSPNHEHQLTKSTSSVYKTLSGCNSKDMRITKLTKSYATPMIKDAPNTHQSSNRIRRELAPKDNGLKTCTTSLRLSSDVRADKMKDMPSSAVQTSQVRKAEIDRTRVRTQDKRLDEIKQVRGGSGIKPKPSQSLHMKDERLESKKKDAVGNRPQMNPSLSRTKVVARSSINPKAEKGPPNSPSLVSLSTITSYSDKKATKTLAVSSLVNKSAHPSSIRNAAPTKVMACVDKETKFKNQTVPVPPINLATKGIGAIRASQSTSEKINKCTIRKVTEKPTLQPGRNVSNRTGARVC